MAAAVTHRAHYDNATGNIRITVVGEPTRIIPLASLTHYNYVDPQHPAKIIKNGGTYVNWVFFQKIIRILDMIKDGKVARKGSGPIPNTVVTVRTLMNLPALNISSTLLGEIAEQIRTDVLQKITLTAWTNPNERLKNIRRLDSRTTYKESGLNPIHLINDPNYCTNIATEVIDPLKRTYGAGARKVQFPPPNCSLEITEEFLNLFGFTNCRLKDTKNGNNVRTSYGLQIENGIILPRDIDDNRPKWWYAGNISKNRYFKEKEHDQSPQTELIKKGLLNVKELGDVLQVLIMFICAKIMFSGGNHTMVTGDEIVFILCIQLDLDCLFYYHPKRSTHQLFHYKGSYNLDDAVKDFNRIKTEVEKTNNEIMRGILRIRDNQNISVEFKSFSMPQGTRLPVNFLEDIVGDMFNITRALFAWRPNTIYSSNPSANNDEKKISLLIHYMTIIKEQYKLKEPFTSYKNDQSKVTFNTGYTSYTRTPPSNIQDAINLEGYTGANTFYSIYTRHYADEVHAAQRQRRGGGGSRLRHQKGGATMKEIREKLDEDYVPDETEFENGTGIFELSFYPIEATIKDKDFEQLGINIDTAISNANAVENANAIKINVHEEWATMVKEQIDKLLKQYSILIPYENDIWWELYDIHYMYGADVSEENIEHLFELIIPNLLRADEINRIAEHEMIAEREASAAAAAAASSAAAAASSASPGMETIYESSSAKSPNMGISPSTASTATASTIMQPLVQFNRSTLKHPPQYKKRRSRSRITNKIKQSLLGLNRKSTTAKISNKPYKKNVEKLLRLIKQGISRPNNRDKVLRLLTSYNHTKRRKNPKSRGYPGSPL